MKQVWAANAIRERRKPEHMNIQKDHVAVITGAGGGLGGALAEALAKKGCHLALADISKEALAETAKSLSLNSGNVTQHVVDVTERKAMETFCDDVLNYHGGVNLLINNAGITLQKNFSTHSLEDWKRMIGINLWGVIYGCHFFDKALTEAEEAHLVNLSSMSAFLGLPGQSSYCATKSGVQLLTDSLMAEWSLKNIGVTSVHPGAIRTNMILATLEESDDIEQAKKNFQLAHKTGVNADFAANKIIRAIEKNKPRIKIGRDSYIFQFIMRFMPSLGNFVMKKVAKKLNP